MSYAKVKGRTPSLFDAKPEVRRPAPPAAPIDEAEHARIRANVDAVKAYLPEFWPFIKELHAAGLIDGLRAIVRVDTHPLKES
jgi:hypothetical protein